MSAIEILREAFFAMLKHWRQAIRIFFLPMIMVIGIYVIALIFTTQSVAIDGQTFQVPSPFLLVLFPFLIFLIFWPVVAWHRLLVLGDQPTGLVPPVRFKAVLRYVLNLVGLGILVSLPMLPIMAIIGPMMISEIDPEAILEGKMLPLKFIICPTLASLPVIYLSIRLCLILPGAAVDKYVGLSGSWNFTRNRGASLPLIALFAAVFSIIFQILIGAITPSRVKISQGALTAFQITQFIGQLLGSLFVISVMSTMFLVFVQDEVTD